jgi:hypothetical protein
VLIEVDADRPVAVIRADLRQRLALESASAW